MDLISRQAAIEALELCDFVMDKEYENGECLLFYDSVIERLKEVPSVQPERWIPVTERLPEETGKYLVTVQNGNVYAGTFSAFENKFSCAAIAWMPLPEPYKGEA